MRQRLSPYQLVRRIIRPSPGGVICGAFTIMELLIVMAILSLLAALLVPGLWKARQLAKRVVCQANLRTLAIAWNNYLDDNDGYFLQGVNMNINYGGEQGAIAAFQRPKPLNLYVGLPDVMYEGGDVFRCPGDVGSQRVRPTYFDYSGTSYQTNLLLIGQDRLRVSRTDPCRSVLRGASDRMRRLSRVRTGQPSKLILLGDAGWVATWTPSSNNRIEWHGTACSHNIAFLDGHVDFLHIRKGLHTTPEYNVIPFKDLLGDASSCQEEVSCE